MSNSLKPLIIGDLEIEIPIVQGGMGIKVSTASLASAVANCGGAGTIASVGLGYGTEENETNFAKASREGLQREIRQAKELTRGRACSTSPAGGLRLRRAQSSRQDAGRRQAGVVGVNILVALSNYEDLARTAAREKADFIVSGAGLPLKLPEYIEGTSTKLIPIVSSARAADIIIRVWRKRYNRLPDAIVVEGPLAGGHLGFKLEDLKSHKESILENLVVDVLKVVEEYERELGRDMPVVAAGGIFDGKDVAKFLKLGARGVQMATRFVTTLECSVADEFKKSYLAAERDDVTIIESPVGMPGRAIKTKFINRVTGGERIPIKCNYRCLKTCNPKAAPYCIAQALFDAVSGNLDEAVVFAGSNVSRVKKIVSVKELMDEVVSEALEELNKA